MLEKFLTVLAKTTNPGRDVEVVKVCGRYYVAACDIVGCNDYLLKDKYSYDEVVAINNLTSEGKCCFGFCEKIGPVAFIGVVCNPKFFNISGYFEYNVHEYGALHDESMDYFEVYSEEEAKKIKNYTVYGDREMKEVATKVPIDKVTYTNDSRYIRKEDFYKNMDIKVVEMDLKLSGTYTFNEARLLATGTIKDKEVFSGDEHPIQFAVVGDNEYVGIINLWYRENILQFRGVWEYGCKEPELQKIRFLTKDEAKRINKFSLYVYCYPYSLKTKQYPIEKQDRTFDKRFKFQLPDGTDYRLI